MCDCKSYNHGTGTTPVVVLTPPKEWGLTYGSGGEKGGVCIDACIAPVIQELWDNGIVTKGSCCGHGKRVPSICLENDKDDRYGRKVRGVIKQVDSREFELLTWRLVTV